MSAPFLACNMYVYLQALRGKKVQEILNIPLFTILLGGKDLNNM
jgi:hypothetical protein